MVVHAGQRCQWKKAARQKLVSPGLVRHALKRANAEEMTGGSSDTQNEFLETLASGTPKRPEDRHKRKPVIANKFALGYTYQDVLDADHEGEGLSGLAELEMYN